MSDGVAPMKISCIGLELLCLLPAFANTGDVEIEAEVRILLARSRDSESALLLESLPVNTRNFVLDRGPQTQRRTACPASDSQQQWVPGSVACES